MTERLVEMLTSKIIEDAKATASTILEEAKISQQRHLEEVQKEAMEKAERECK
ncbi:MAG: hypothetical protein ACUVTM_01625 [Candidatus Bathyarchaeia archaeon]